MARANMRARVSRSRDELGVLAILLLVAVLPVRPLLAKDVAALEHEIKAAFLVKFANFVEWPPDAFDRDDNALVIGVIGQDPFGSALDKITAGRTVKGRPCEVRRFRDLSDLRPCHILFIGGTERSRIEGICRAVGNEPVLTIGEADGFMESGGIINFVVVGDTVRFEINQDSAAKARLNISSKLLRLATPREKAGH